MDFKKWFNLTESFGDEELIKTTLINYQNNPNDESAKESFYKQVNNFVKFWCLSKKCDRTGISSEDLASDVVEKLLRKMQEDNFLHSLDAERFPRYLTTVTNNLKIDATRRKMRKKRLGGISLDAPVGNYDYDLKSNIASGQISSEEEQMNNEMKEIIHKAITKLEKPEDRKLADMIFYQDKTYDVIAKELGIPLGTVKSRTNALKIKLRNALEGIND